PGCLGWSFWGPKPPQAGAVYAAAVTSAETTPIPDAPLALIPPPPPSMGGSAALSVTFDGSDPALYLNRELSWLEFNARVLAEAGAGDVPLYERLKFLSIFFANLDEFLM